MKKNAIVIVAGLVVVAAVYKGSPATKSVAGPEGGATRYGDAAAPADRAPAAPAAGGSGVVKYLKPLMCPPECAPVVTYAVRQETAIDGKPCHPSPCFVLERFEADAPPPGPDSCPPVCRYILVDEPDGTCEYKVIIEDASSGFNMHCPPTCAYSIEPCTPPDC